jgi:hypothetical protein
MLKATNSFGFEFSFAGGIVISVLGGGVVAAGGSLCYYTYAKLYLCGILCVGFRSYLCGQPDVV